MSIREVKDSSGNVSYSVTINLRSPTDRNLRVQKNKFGLKSLNEAKKAELQLRREAERELVSREQKSGAWATLVDEWELILKKHDGFGKIGLTTGEDYVQSLRMYTSDWFSRTPEEITQSDVVAVLTSMDRLGRSKSRKQCVVIAINQVFKWGVSSRFVKAGTQSPAFGIAVKRDEERKPEILTIGQIKKLLECAKAYDHAWYPVWAMALLTGMRSGELHALVWDDVDLEGSLITVKQSYNGRLKKVKCTKSGFWREVPINSDLLILMKELKLSSGGRPHVLPRFSAWTSGATAAVLRAFCTGVGIPSVKFHALRACFATQLLKNKVAPAIVMKICGWKDLKTMQRYIRLSGIEIEGATDSLQLLSGMQVMGKVVQLYGSGSCNSLAEQIGERTVNQ